MGERRAEVIRKIGPRAYLRSVWAVLWNTFRHPFTTTVIDLSTGEAVNLPPPEPDPHGETHVDAAGERQLD